MDQHITILGILHIAWNLFTLLIVCCVAVWIIPATLVSGDEIIAATGLVVFAIIGAITLVFTLPGIVGGIGILYRKPWARAVLLIAGALALFNFPFGTAIGIYTFWVLLNDETSRLLT